MANKDLKIGDRVRLDHENTQWGLCDTNPNPKDISGTVVDNGEWSGYIRVKWDNNTNNSYLEEDNDLVKVEDSLEIYETNSVFVKSRSEARKIKKEQGGTIVDHGEQFTTKSRWEVVFDELVEEIVHKEVTPPIDWEKTFFVITPKSVEITLSDGSQHTVPKKKDEYSKVAQLAMEEKYEEMMQYVDRANAVKVLTFGSDIRIEGGVLYYYNEVIDSSIASRIIDEAQKVDGNAEKFINFFRKLYANPSYKAVKHTYDFMVYNDLEILDNGNIKAWKGVSLQDGVPKAHYGVINYRGYVLEMPRNQVEDNEHITCSYGLHVAAKEYAEGFGTYLIEIGLSPTDVVSVPVDYDNMKLRACKYEVLTGTEHPEGVRKHVLINKNGEVLKETII